MKKKRIKNARFKCHITQADGALGASFKKYENERDDQMEFTCFVLCFLFVSSFRDDAVVASKLFLPEKMLRTAHHDGFMAIRSMPYTGHNRINMMKNLISHFHIFDAIELRTLCACISVFVVVFR